MPRKAPAALPPPTGERICCFCGLKDDNELDYGKFHEHDGIITHYYCLLFSSNMQQKGLDDEGILGFLPGDINKELRRGRRLACCYCKKIGATLGCCNTKCKKIFHFPCGLKAGSLHQYFGEFRSYCIHHRPKQNIDERIMKELSQCETKICYICYDEVKPRDNLQTIWAPCCKKNAWFHRTCVQQLAMSAGYFFKCPLCNNKVEFQRAMLDHGIFIPSQDASWELVPNAFQELLYRHNRCDAETCLCPKGREYTGTNAKWELTLCRTCGSQGIHMSCGNLKWGESMWECNECISILNKSDLLDGSQVTRLSDGNRVNRDDEGLSTDEDSNSDSEISVGSYSEVPMETIVRSSLIPQSFHLQKNTETEVENTEKSSITRSTKTLENGFGRNNETRDISRNNDELPPLTKKQKISDLSNEDTHGDANDESDDDIVVVSGPSRKETFRSHDDMQKDSSEVQISSSGFIDASTKAQVHLTSSSDATSTVEKLVPIEIDLSDSENASTTSSTEPVSSKSAANVTPEVPELKIQITNVTSLAPEVFESAPEFVDRSINASANCDQNRTSVCTVIQKPPAPELVYEQMQIVRLNHISDAYYPANAFLYGLTIPGTCNTVPLLISSAELQTSTPPLQEARNHSQLHPTRPNDGLGLFSTMSNFAETSNNVSWPIVGNSTIQENGQRIVVTPTSNISSMQTHEILTAALTKSNNLIIHNNETSSTPINLYNDKSMCVAPKLTYSVPLETVMNDQMIQSQSVKKCASERSVADSSMMIKETRGKSVITNRLQENPTEAKSTDISSGTAANPFNNIPLNDVSSSISHVYSAMQSDVSPESQSEWIMPNGLRISRVPENLTLPLIRGSNDVEKGYNHFKSIATRTSAKPTNDTMEFSNLNRDVTPADNGLSPKMRYGKTLRTDNEIGGDISSDQNILQASSNDCDGDAGSGSAVQSTSVNATKINRTIPTSNSQLVAATDTRDACSGDRKIKGKDDVQHEAESVAEKPDSSECSTTADRSNSSNRTGLMNKMINVRDLKFTVRGPNIVKMTIYESFCVNINVENGRKRNNLSQEASNLLRRKSSESLNERTNNCSLIRKNGTLKIENNDCENFSSPLTNPSAPSVIGKIDNEISNQFSNNPQTTVIPRESEIKTNEASHNGIHSRVQDELKENLNPVPSPSNLANDITNVIERKSKTRLRSQTVNHTIQMLNERESQEKINDENNGNSRQVANNDQALVKTSSKNSHNIWKDSTCSVAREETNSTYNSSSDRHNEKFSKKSRIRGSCANDGSKISDHVEPAAKRPKYIRDEHSTESQEREILTVNNSKNDHFTAMSHPANNGEKSQDPMKNSRVNVRKNVKLNINNVMKNRKRTRETRESNDNATPCCKVSIDLAKIQSILAEELNEKDKIKDRKFHSRKNELSFESENRKIEISYTKLIHCDVPRKSRSLVNLSVTDILSVSRRSNVKIRRSKSLENLETLTRQLRCDNTFNSFRAISSAEITRQSYERKTRSFEKHDCVR